MTRVEFGKKILERLEEDLGEIATVDSRPKMEGRSMTMVMSPRSEVVKKAQDAKAKKAQEKDNENRQEQAGEQPVTLESGSESN